MITATESRRNEQHLFSSDEPVRGKSYSTKTVKQTNQDFETLRKQQNKG